jgi:hypothetical protein
MPLARSIIIGFVTAFIIAGVTPLFMLGEWNGPINFAVPFLIVACSGLAVPAFFAKPQGWRRSFVAGLGFATPVAVFCFLIPLFVPVGDHIRQFALCRNRYLSDIIVRNDYSRVRRQ